MHCSINYKSLGLEGYFSRKAAKFLEAQSVKRLFLSALAPLRFCVIITCVSFLFCSKVNAQQKAREDILLNEGWLIMPTGGPLKDIPPNMDDYFKTAVNIPHNLDAYDGYRRLLHGNRHGGIWYKKILRVKQGNKSRRVFLFF
jgi:hypothetical protein